MSSPDDLLDFTTLPGVSTGVSVGGGIGWKAPAQAELDALEDGQTVAINKSGVVRQATWDAKNRVFRYKDEHKLGKGDIINRIEGATEDPNDPASLELDWSPLARFPFKGVSNMVASPENLDAVGVGEGALKTAGKEAIRAAAPATAGLGAFMLTSARTPGPPIVKVGAGLVTSALTSAGVQWLQDQSGLIPQTDQDIINSTVNPMAAKGGAFSPTLIAFRPSYGVLRAAAGLGGNVERDVALETIKQGGLMNLGIAQGGAMIDPIIHGSPDPNINRFQASARTLGFGDPTKENGGGIGNRLQHAATEYGIGGLLLHKPWGVGSLLHNVAHAGNVAEQVKFSGAPTEEALVKQRQNIVAAAEVRAAVQEAAARQKAEIDKNANNPIKSETSAGIDQVRSVLTESLKTNRIDQQTHDDAQAIVTTLGEEVLKNIQLRQVGGKHENGNTIEGEAIEGTAIDPKTGSKGLVNSVLVFARAIRTGKFTSTLSHEIFHPLFESLKPEVQRRALSDLAREREKVRSKDRVFDEILKFFKADNSGDWLGIADKRFSMDEVKAIMSHLRNSGISESEVNEGINRWFNRANDGSIKLRNELIDEDGKASRRLWNVREFVSVEAARIIQGRGQYDKRWGTTDGSYTNFIKSFYNAMKRSLLRKIGKSNTVDDILDHITKGTLKDATNGDDIIAKNALTAEASRAVDENLRSERVDIGSAERAIGDILESPEFKAQQTERNKESTETDPEAEFQRRLNAEQRRLKSEQRANARAIIETGNKLNEEGKFDLPGQSEEGRDFARRNLSEGDAEPELPETSKEALKKLGIKNTVIGNVVRHSKIGSIRSQFDKAVTSGEVAHIFRSTSQLTQESIQVLVTDKDGNPLEIYRHTLSEPGSSTLAPYVLVANALSVKGSKNVWISHNHPSMTPSFSTSDMNTEYNLRDFFKGTGLNFAGFLAIAGDKYAAISAGTRRSTEEHLTIPGDRNNMSGREIPIVERRFTIPRGGPEDVVSKSSANTRVGQENLIKELLGDKPGVIFLNGQGRAVGFQEVPAEKLAKLGPSGARNLLAAFSRSGASEVLVHVGGDNVPANVRTEAGDNISRLGNKMSPYKRPIVRNIISTDTSPTGYTFDSNMRGEWKSEGDEVLDRGEVESRSVVGNIKPLHAAPGLKFPIVGKKLTEFGFDVDYLNQFSEHAVVGELDTGVDRVHTASDVASLMYDYTGKLVQGQTMLLIVGEDGKPIQVGLHMINMSSRYLEKDVIKPMWGVLAGMAVSTPGAKEAWFIRANNDFPVETGGIAADEGIGDEVVLKNLLDQSGIRYRGLVSLSGRKFFSREYKDQRLASQGRDAYESKDSGWQDVSILPKTGTVPLTERRYSTRSQVPYEAGDTAFDRTEPSESSAWNRSESASAAKIKEHLQGSPGVLFKTSSGKIVGSVRLTIDEMANIRNSPAQRKLLAMMDRTGVNWGMVSIGDAPDSNYAKGATSNVNAFLKQMGLKVTDTFHNNSSMPVEGDPMNMGEFSWKSEGDAETIDNPEYGVNRGIRKPSLTISSTERQAANIPWSNFDLSDGVGRAGLIHTLDGHLHDFEREFGELGKTFAEKKAAVKRIITAVIDSREGFARTGAGETGSDGESYRAKQDNRITIIGMYGGVPVQVIIDTRYEDPRSNQLIRSNKLVSAYPIDKYAYDKIKSRPENRFVSSKDQRAQFDSGAEIRRLQARAGLQNPNETVPGPDRGKPEKTPLADPDKSADGPHHRRRGILGKFYMSEGDAAEFSDRAEKALQADSIVGPEAIRGDFLGWAKGIKELANEHLFQHPFPTQYKDGADRERDQQRLQSHRIIDQLIAKLERQKGFNPMTLKPGFLDAVRRVSTEAMMSSFKELAREAVNVHDATGLDPEAGGYIPPSDNLDAPNAERDQAHKKNLDWHWGKVKDYQQQFIKHVRLSMDTGMLNKQTGMELIDMANEIRSRTFNRADEYGNIRGWGRMSEGDAENMRIPGGARDEFIKRRPARQNKGYLDIGHGDKYALVPGEGPRPAFDPENVFLYHYDSNKRQLTSRRISDMAEEQGLDKSEVQPDTFVHGLSTSGVGLKHGESGINGRIEIDHDKQKIYVSAGSSRGDLMGDIRGNDFRDAARRDALKEIRGYIKDMQKRGDIPKGYQIEGYGYDMNRSTWEGQERFSVGDEEGSLTTSNHGDKTLEKNGFITNYVKQNPAKGFGPDDLTMEVRNEESRMRIRHVSRLTEGGEFKLEVFERNGRSVGHIYFSVSKPREGRIQAGYVQSTIVREQHENKGVAKIMYAELGERLRRSGIEQLGGMVIDYVVNKETGEVTHRPIKAREAVFGLGSTEVNHVYSHDAKSEREWEYANVKTTIDKNRKLSEGDEEPVMPPDTNPRTNNGEIANHTNVQLAKRGFISNFANSEAKSLANMKIRIGLQTHGNKPPVPITGDMKIDFGKEENTFQGVVEYLGENGLTEAAQFTYVIKNAFDPEDRQGDSSETSSTLDWIKVMPQFRNRNLSTVITAEVVERLRRNRQEMIDAYVVDPAGRPIRALQTVLGDNNVDVYDNGFEETNGRDQFRIPDPRSDTGFVRHTRDIEGKIDPKKLYSEGDDGENMRIPGGARDNFRRASEKVSRPKPIKFWLDVGHANRTDAEGEQNTYLWYATKKGDIQVISADDLRNVHSPEGYQLIESDDIPAHVDWERALAEGFLEGDFGSQPIMDLPHGRIDDRGDVTRISFLQSRESAIDTAAEGKRASDYEHNREEIKKKLAEWMGKKADDVAGYDFSQGNNPERFSVGDDGENMRIPGGARDEALKKREAMLRQKRFRKADIDVLYTDIGHPDDFGTSGEMDTVNDISRQFLWSYDRYGQFHMQSLKEAVEAYNQARKDRYDRLVKEGADPEEIDYLLSPENEGSFTHTEWAKGLGLKDIRELDYNIGNGRVDITDDGKVRMSWVAKIEDVRERQLMAEQIKEEAASWLNSNKGQIQIPVSKGMKTPFRGTSADKIVGWNWGHGSDRRTGQPRRFSEGDAENGRWPNQERAKGRIPDARVRNGETDLGFVLDAGEELDSKGLRVRNNTMGRMFWGDIGHDAEYFTQDPAVLEALGKTLPSNFDSSTGLFAYDSKTGRIITTQERVHPTHLDWLNPTKSDWSQEGFGEIDSRYAFMGRFEPAIIGTDGKIIRRGRISIAKNDVQGNWVNDLQSMSRADFPEGLIGKVKDAVADESNAILDYKNRAKFEPAQDTAADHYDTFGFGMSKDKAELGFSPKDTGPLKLDEDAKTYRDLADRPIGEGKDGQERLLKIGRKLSEGDSVEEAPFRIPKTAGRRTNIEIAKDIATARFFTGISTKAHENADQFPVSKTMRRIANMIHARAGAEAGVTKLDLPTSIMTERTKHMNRFFEIMDPLRGDFASMSRDARETAYQEMAEMITGERSIDTSTPAGRAAEGLKQLLKDLHQYRTDAGEKLGEVQDYFPAVYDSIYISENAMQFKEDAKKAYMIELRDMYQGEELDAAAEKAARELTMSHIRGEGEGSFNNLFESDSPAMGENSSMKRKFGPDSQKIMSKWQVKDPYRIISRYIAGATKRAELVRRLGDEGQEWRKMAKALENEGVSYEKIDEMRELLKSSVGVGRQPNTRGEQTFIDLMGLYTAGSVMGRSFLNNMFEPASMGIRSGNLALGLQAYGETWGRTIRNAARILSGEKIDKSFWEKYAEHIGTISADINDAWMNSHSIEVDGDRSDPRINWLTSKVYQSNLLQMTENAKLQASHAIGFRYLVGLAEMHNGNSWMSRFNVTESVKSNLRELGIDDADHTQFSNWMERLSKLDDAGRMRMLTSGGKMSKLFETAITKFSMQSAVRASRAHKPTFQDGPIGKTLFQLMSYSYSYAAEVNSRTYSYAKSSLKSAPANKSYSVGDRVRFIAPLMMVPLGIIAYRALFALKDELYPTEYSKKHENDPSWTKWLNATSYAGAFGPKVEMATKYVMRDQPPGGPLGQTLVAGARAAKTAITNTIEGKPQDNAKRQAAKAAVQPIKAATVIGATAAHPAAGAIASQIANTTGWSNAMTEPDKSEAKKKPKERR